MNNERKKLEASKQLIQDKIDALDNPKFEVGWYWADQDAKDDRSFLSYCDSIKQSIAYGFGWGGVWSECLCVRFHNINIKATDKEVEEALIKEAKKRGFTEGVIVSKDNFKYYKRSEKLKRETRFIVRYEDGAGWVIFCCGSCIFEDGKWATIIEDPKLVVNGYEMKIDEKTVSFGCAKFSTHELLTLNSDIDAFNLKCIGNRTIKSFTLDSGVTITTEELQQICTKIEQHGNK